jgi:hypothetical protein
MAQKPAPKQPQRTERGELGQTKGNIKPTSEKPSGGPPPKPATPPKK